MPKDLLIKIQNLFQQGEFKKLNKLLTNESLIQQNNALFFAYKSRVTEDAMSAIGYAQKAIALNPKLEIAYLAMGNSYSELKEPEKAIQEYTKAIEAKDDFADAYYNRGTEYFESKEFHKALDDFNKAIQLNPNESAYYENRGNLNYDLKEYAKSLQDYSKSIDLDNNQVSAYINRGNLLYDLKDYENALLDYNKAIELDDTDPDIYLNRGDLWYNLKNFDNALLDYNKAIGLDPKHIDSYLNRGNYWDDLKNYPAALKDYDKAISLDENYADAYYNRALTYTATGEYQKAIENYDYYLVLENDVNDYYVKIAKEEVTQLKEKIRIDWNYKIDTIIGDIKILLQFNESCVTHYTSLSGAKAMVLDGSPFRLSEGAFLNDTSEGRELLKYLDFEKPIFKKDDTLAEVFVERPFIGSFVSDSKHDDLTLWRMYGKESQAEAKGCALTINRDKFILNLEAKVYPDSSSFGNIIQREPMFTFYKVAYRNNDDFFIPGASDEDVKTLSKLIVDLKQQVLLLKNEQMLFLSKQLNEIIYLFKSAEYQYEHEVRLVIDGTGFGKKITKDSQPPKVFVELIEITPVLRKITLGPKVERAEEWAAGFNYHAKESNNKPLEIVISHLPFK